MTGDQRALLVHQDRVGPPPFQDGGGEPLDVGRAVKPRVVRIGYQPFDRLARPGRPALAVSGSSARPEHNDVIIHLATALAVQYVYSNKNTDTDLATPLHVQVGDTKFCQSRTTQNVALTNPATRLTSVQHGQ